MNNLPRHLGLMLLALVIAGIWGYFSDLRNGQVEWFVLRLALCVGIVLIWSILNRQKA